MFTIAKKESSSSKGSRLTNIVVIGGGIAGVLSALECAKQGRRVRLVEQRPDILLGTSRNQSYRLHTGLHYPDQEFITSIKCLIDTVFALRKLPPHCVNMQTSRYYLMSNSLYDEAHMKKTALLVQLAYQDLVNQDSANKVLGEPDQLIRFLNPEEYQTYVGSTIPFVNENAEVEKIYVVFAIDIVEPIIRLDELRDYLLHQLAENPRIEIFVNHRVISVDERDEDFGYQVFIEHNQIKSSFICDAIVNASWEESEHVNPEVFNEFLSCELINRMKISLLIKLPEEFLLKKIPSSLFSYGPHAALVVLENGTGVMTWEPETNVGSWVPQDKPSEIVDLLRKGISLEDDLGRKKADAIIKGFSEYIPCLSGAVALELRIGYVRTPVQVDEKFSIYDKNSSIHYRRDSGVRLLSERYNLGYIVNEARKFTYGLSNATQVELLINSEILYIQFWQKLFDELCDSESVKVVNFTHLSSILNLLVRYINNQIKLIVEKQEQAIFSDLSSAEFDEDKIVEYLQRESDCESFSFVLQMVQENMGVWQVWSRQLSLWRSVISESQKNVRERHAIAELIKDLRLPAEMQPIGTSFSLL